jgi:hypothetical protein
MYDEMALFNEVTKNLVEGSEHGTSNAGTTTDPRDLLVQTPTRCGL